MRAADTALDATNSGSPAHCSVPDEPVEQGNWVTVRRHNRGSKHRFSIPIKTLNSFSPLSDAPTEKPDESALVIGDSIVRNVKIETPATIVHCLPGARAPDILANLKVLANAKRKSVRLLFASALMMFDFASRRSLKIMLRGVCTCKYDVRHCNMLWPAPLLTGAMRFIAGLLSLNGWMSKWCPAE